MSCVNLLLEIRVVRKRRHANGDAAALAVFELIDPLAALINRSERGLCSIQERAAVVVEYDAATNAVEQLNADLSLELLDIEAQRC